MSYGDDILREVKEIHEVLYGGLMPHIIVLEEANPLDDSTPVDMPLKCVGWGDGSECVSYDIPGWDEIAEQDDPHFIVSSGEGETRKLHVVRVNTPQAHYYKKLTAEQLEWKIGCYFE